MKWTIGNKLSTGFGMVIVALIIFSIFIIGKLNEYNRDIMNYEEIQKEIHISQNLELRIANIWQFFTDASLTKDEDVIKKEVMPQTALAFEDIKELLRILEGRKEYAQMEQFEKIKTSLSEFQEIGLKLFEAYVEDWEKGNIVMEEFDEVADKSSTGISGIVEDMNKESLEAIDEMLLMAINTRSMTIIVVLCISLFIIIFSLILIRSITRPLKEGVDFAENVANGNLSTSMKVKSSDEIGQLAGALNTMVASLNETAGVADMIAEGDLTVAVVPKSDKDALNISFKKMIDSLNATADVAVKIADGDLTAKIVPKSDKDTLNVSFMKMIDKLNNVIRGILEASDQIAASADELTNTSQNLAKGAQKQAAALEETSSAMEEMSKSVLQVSDRAQNQASSVEEVTSSVTELNNSIKTVAKKSTQVSEGATGSVAQAQDAEKSSSLAIDGMKKIEDSANRIEDIIGVIDDIADQTNLLALNASIEAARAGSAGRGFAVVAKEISKLADKSSEATKEIAILINETGKNVENGSGLLSQLDNAIKKLGETAVLSKQLGDEVADATEGQLSGFKQINDSMGNMNEMAQGIASASEEQSGTAEEMNKTLDGVNVVTQQAASSAEEMASSTEELSGQAENLREVVLQFKVK